jgi:hypothetical protein
MNRKEIEWGNMDCIYLAGQWQAVVKKVKARNF